MKLHRFAIGALAVAAAFTLAYRYDVPPLGNLKKLLGSVFFVASTTENELHARYTNAEQGVGKIKILIVPGHDEEVWGTEYRGVREADLTRKVGTELFALLRQEKEFDVTVTRDERGYTPEFASYFARERDAIQSFYNTQEGIMDTVVSAGLVERYHGVPHNVADENVRVKLYGINKWANEHKIDLVIHLHMNDYNRPWEKPGEYSGFAIYVPERQFSNAGASVAVARAVAERLAHNGPQSDLPKENTGVVEDQDLIAVGTNNSLDAAGILIEYGYIYESQLWEPKIQGAMLHELALQTFWGVKDFFEIPAQKTAVTSLLPHEWNNDLASKTKSRDVLSLQSALIREGLYPPSEGDLHTCPINGNYGKCTLAAVQSFQKKYGIAPANGRVGQHTREKLNELY